jgi:hypothetical protein
VVPVDSLPIACDLTQLTESPAQRLARFRQLFDDALLGRERTPGGVRFRFRDAPGVQARVRELAVLEARCCAFLDFAVRVPDGDHQVPGTGELVVEVTGDSQDPAVRAVLDDFYGYAAPA